MNPEKSWQQKFNYNIKPIYLPEIDGPKGIFFRLAGKDSRERRFNQFMNKTTKDMEEISKKERADLIKKMIKN